jgi:hypothetical protein
MERKDQTCIKECLFCNNTIGNNRANIIDHFLKSHNFNIGLPDNIGNLTNKLNCQ